LPDIDSLYSFIIIYVNVVAVLIPSLKGASFCVVTFRTGNRL